MTLLRVTSPDVPGISGLADGTHHGFQILQITEALSLTQPMFARSTSLSYWRGFSKHRAQHHTEFRAWVTNFPEKLWAKRGGTPALRAVPKQSVSQPAFRHFLSPLRIYCMGLFGCVLLTTCSLEQLQICLPLKFCYNIVIQTDCKHQKLCLISLCTLILDWVTKVFS